MTALYEVLIVALTALPCHFKLIASSATISADFLSPKYLDIWLVVGAGLAVVVGLIATIVPLRRGVKAFNRLEFS